jgi:hypothetical protein
LLGYGRRATDRAGRRADDPRPAPADAAAGAGNHGRREEDRNHGRRASDAPRDRRATDAPPAERRGPATAVQPNDAATRLSTEVFHPSERDEAAGPLSLTETLQRLVVEARRQS